MNFRIGPVWLLLCTLSLSLLQAQEELELKLYSVEDGLSHRNVFKVKQDPRGFIWVATLNGLNQFDGYRFRQFTPDSKRYPLPMEQVEDLYIENNQTLWISSDNQLIRYHPYRLESQQTNTYPKDTSDSRIKVRNHLIGMDSSGLLVTTQAENRTRLLVRRVTDNGRVMPLASLPKPDHQQRVCYLNGFLFTGSERADIRKLSAVGDSLSSIPIPSRRSLAGLQAVGDTSIIALLDDYSLWRMAPHSKKLRRIPLPPLPTRPAFPPETFLIDRQGDIWLAGPDQLWRYSFLQKSWDNYFPQLRQLTKVSPQIRQIYQDLTGVYWLATDFGLVKIVKSDNRIKHYLSGGNEYCSNGYCSTRGITEDESGRIYISYYNSIHVIDPDDDRTYPLFGNRNFFNYPYGLLHHQGALWTGNGRRIDLKTLEVDTLFAPLARDKGTVTRDDKGQLWFAYDRQLYYYHPEKEALNTYRDTTGTLDTLREISYLFFCKSDRQLWLGTRENGLYSLKPESGQITAHFHTGSPFGQRLNHNRIIALQEMPGPTLWMATADGVHRLDLNSKRIRYWTEEEGLSHPFVNGLLPEGDSIVWISTDHGLSRYHRLKQQFVNFYQKDGLTNNEFNRISFHRSDDGRLYFGGLNGVNAFYPGPWFSKTPGLSKGRLLLTSFYYLDGSTDSLVSRFDEVDSLNPIELSHRDRLMGFEFTLTDYTAPQQNSYSYKLDGFDSDWSNWSNLTTTRYHNVPAGNYVFRVRAITPNGQEVSEDLTVPIYIQQAYYKQPWFWPLLVLVALLLLYSLYRYRIYRLRNREKALELEVQLRTAELRKEKKKSDDLLLNILPAEVAEELKREGRSRARRHEEVTVMFCDFKGFTQIAERLSPVQLVEEIDYCFRHFDEIVEHFGLEKIKTIGDAYMCVGGIGAQNQSNASAVVRAAKEFQRFLKESETEGQHHGFRARIGIHTGPVVSGIVGIKKFAYDIWGDTVNIAARMEQNSEPGRINLSATTYQLVKDDFTCTYRGKISAKNKGLIDMYYVKD